MQLDVKSAIGSVKMAGSLHSRCTQHNSHQHPPTPLSPFLRISDFCNGTPLELINKRKYLHTYTRTCMAIFRPYSATITRPSSHKLVRPTSAKISALKPGSAQTRTKPPNWQSASGQTGEYVLPFLYIDRQTGRHTNTIPHQGTHIHAFEPSKYSPFEGNTPPPFLPVWPPGEKNPGKSDR